MATPVDSRRIPGASLFGDEPGAVLDVRLDGDDAATVAAAWEREARDLLDVVGWVDSRTAWRATGGDLSLFLSAPGDALYAATEVNETAWDRARLARSGEPPRPLGGDATALGAAIRSERNPAWTALADEAARRGVAVLPDGDAVTVGMGCGSFTVPSRAIPEPDLVPWELVHDVPVALVTGTNGKSTTVRLAGAIVAAWGRVCGLTTTDGLKIGPESIGTGDYSGPEGARRVLRDPRVEVAILETARGGLQRRGLALRRVDVAVITNLAEDHLGEFGVRSLDDIAAIKLVVAQALRPGAPLVANADDPGLAARVRALPRRLAWFSLEADHDVVRSAVAAGGDAAWLDGGRLVLARGGEVAPVSDVADVPATFGGAARHNVANALAAMLASAALGAPDDAIARGLASFEGRPSDNPGRANLLRVGGVTVLVDFAHNPHGMQALVGLARSIPAGRRLVVLGQAGDRDDDALRAFARAAWGLAPDRVIVKEMAAYLRGRAPGEIPRILEDELVRLGARPDQIAHAPSEIEAVRQALSWGRDGDLLVLPTHSDRREVLELLDERGAR